MRGPRIKVLLADDDEDQLAIRKMLLDHSGFEAIAASDCASALQAARNEHPCCAVVDLCLPEEEDGLALIRDLRALGPEMCIFVITGRNPARLKGLPERQLINEVIEKGFASAKLIQKLRGVALAASMAGPDRA